MEVGSQGRRRGDRGGIVDKTCEAITIMRMVGDPIRCGRVAALRIQGYDDRWVYMCERHGQTGIRIREKWDGENWVPTVKNAEVA